MTERKPTQREKNLRFWNEFFKTDPDFTKPFTRGGGFKGTDINPLHRMNRMTEVFGPIGQGWGYEILEDKEVHLTDGRGMWFSKVTVWYVDPEDPEKRYTVGPQWGGTALIEKRKDGSLVMDDEAPKKSVTDGIGKCLSYLGVSADVYLGYWDDSKYVNSLRSEFGAPDKTTPAKPEVDPEEAARLEEAAKWRDMVVAKVKKLTTTEAIEKWWKESEQVAALAECKEKHPDIYRFVVTQVKARVERLKEVAGTP